MTAKTTIYCDWCEKDLTETRGNIAYRIVVKSERIENVSDVEYNIRVFPPVNGVKHFCCPNCLRGYFEPRPTIDIACDNLATEDIALICSKLDDMNKQSEVEK